MHFFSCFVLLSRAAILFGAIPIIITKSRSKLWLPYDIRHHGKYPYDDALPTHKNAGTHRGPGIDWDALAIILEERELHLLPLLVLGMSPQEKMVRRSMMANLANSHFSNAGIIRQIDRYVLLNGVLCVASDCICVAKHLDQQHLLGQQ